MNFAERIGCLTAEQRVYLAGKLEVGTGESKELVAYMVPTGAERGRDLELRRFLQTKLPSFMVPSRFIWIDSLPRTANGKVDRKALALQSATSTAQPLAEGGSNPGTNGVEAQIASIWGEVLRVSDIGFNDNFFELGGHSLLAIQVLARIREFWGVEIPMRTIFESPTIADLAAAIAERTAEAGESLKG